VTQLEVSRTGRVSILTLKRPEHGNRLSRQMAEELTAALEAIRRDPLVAACVMTGHGEVFCLGGDYKGAGPTVAGRAEFARASVDLYRAMAALGKPLVAAVNGNAHAGGFSLVAAADLAVMADDATLGLPEAANGLFPFLALAVVRDALPKKVLFDIVYNARLIGAPEACDLHLVNKSVARTGVLEEAIRMAETAGSYNADIVMLGRDLYYNMRGVGPAEAVDKSRFALMAALAAKDQEDKPTDRS
jgi:enoyl-CoA hydratase/carnithine racemase